MLGDRPGSNGNNSKVGVHLLLSVRSSSIFRTVPTRTRTRLNRAPRTPQLSL